MNTRKHGLRLFLASCLPGCGQMYQGYMNRGLSLMLIFYGTITLMGLFLFDALLFLLFPIWLYAYFDSYNLRARADAGIPAEDDFLFGVGAADSSGVRQLLHKRHSLIGWLLVGMGGYMLYDRTVRRVAESLLHYDHLRWVYDLLVYDIPRLAVSLVVIWLGLWFIRGPKAAPEEIPTFTPPAAPEEAAAVQEVPAEQQEESNGAE